MSRRYGCIQSVVNPSNAQLCRFVETTELSSYDLRTTVNLPNCVNDIDQGTLGSCTANAIAFAYLFETIVNYLCHQDYLFITMKEQWKIVLIQIQELKLWME